jgi:hypothetical protein
MIFHPKAFMHRTSTNTNNNNHSNNKSRHYLIHNNQQAHTILKNPSLSNKWPQHAHFNQTNKDILFSSEVGDDEKNNSSSSDDLHLLENDLFLNPEIPLKNQKQNTPAAMVQNVKNTKQVVSENRFKLIERNKSCLGVLTESDIIEYVEQETDLDDRDNPRNWALYMGNSMIIRFCKDLGTIVYESYWRIATRYLIYINKDLDKRLYNLATNYVLNRARKAYSNRDFYSKLFSCDRNFVTWCKFDINKSDIEFAIMNVNFTKSKEFILEKFMNSLKFESLNNNHNKNGNEDDDASIRESDIL